MNRQSEIALLETKLSELRTHKVELDAVIRRYVPKDGDVLVPKPIDPVLQRLKTMTAEELLPFVVPGTGDRKRITQALREGNVTEYDLVNLVPGVVRDNLLPDEVSARAVSLAEWTTKNDEEIATVRSRYQAILDKFAAIEQQIEETETKYESLTNLYEIKVGGTETQTRSRGVSGTARVRALSVEEAIEKVLEEKSDEVEWTDNEYFEDGDSEYEMDDEIEEENVELIEDNTASAKAAGV